MDINNVYKILMVSTVYDEFHFFKLIWKNGYLSYQIVYNGDSMFSGLKKGKKVNYQPAADEPSFDKIEDQPIRKMKKENSYKNNV